MRGWSQNAASRALTSAAARRHGLRRVDHVDPSLRTAAGNLGALCRHTHRLKHLGGWTLTQASPGHFHWTSAGLTYDVQPRPVTPPLPALRPRPDRRPRIPIEETLTQADPDEPDDTPTWVGTDPLAARRAARAEMRPAAGATPTTGQANAYATAAPHYPDEPPF